MKLASQNRTRATKGELDALRERIIRIADTSRPLSVRNLFYQLLTDDGTGAYIEKSENAYQKVCRLKSQLCREKEIPWGHFADSTRISYAYTGFTGLGDSDFVDQVARLYRRDVWATTGIYPQLWVESRSLAPTLAGLASSIGVDLYPSGGMSSDSFVHGAAVDAVLTERPTFAVVYVGDFDPAGLQIADALNVKLGEHLADAAEDYDLPTPALDFQRVAITQQQIADYRLPTKPVKATQSRKRYDLADTVEAEAMRPADLRQIVADAFEPMLDRRRLDLLRTVEAAERVDLRERLAAMAG